MCSGELNCKRNSRDESRDTPLPKRVTSVPNSRENRALMIPPDPNQKRAGHILVRYKFAFVPLLEGSQHRFRLSEKVHHIVL